MSSLSISLSRSIPSPQGMALGRLLGIPFLELFHGSLATLSAASDVLGGSKKFLSADLVRVGVTGAFGQGLGGLFPTAFESGSSLCGLANKGTGDFDQTCPSGRLSACKQELDGCFSYIFGYGAAAQEGPAGAAGLQMGFFSTSAQLGRAGIDRMFLGVNGNIISTVDHLMARCNGLPEVGIFLRSAHLLMADFKCLFLEGVSLLEVGLLSRSAQLQMAGIGCLFVKGPGAIFSNLEQMMAFFSNCNGYGHASSLLSGVVLFKPNSEKDSGTGTGGNNEPPRQPPKEPKDPWEEILRLLNKILGNFGRDGNESLRLLNKILEKLSAGDAKEPGRVVKWMQKHFGPTATAHIISGVKVLINKCNDFFIVIIIATGCISLEITPVQGFRILRYYLEEKREEMQRVLRKYAKMAKREPLEEEDVPPTPFAFSSVDLSTQEVFQMLILLRDFDAELVRKILLELSLDQPGGLPKRKNNELDAPRVPKPVEGHASGEQAVDNK